MSRWYSSNFGFFTTSFHFRVFIDRSTSLVRLSINPQRLNPQMSVSSAINFGYKRADRRNKWNRNTIKPAAPENGKFSTSRVLRNRKIYFSISCSTRLPLVNFSKQTPSSHTYRLLIRLILRIRKTAVSVYRANVSDLQFTKSSKLSRVIRPGCDSE